MWAYFLHLGTLKMRLGPGRHSNATRVPGSVRTQLLDFGGEEKRIVTNSHIHGTKSTCLLVSSSCAVWRTESAIRARSPEPQLKCTELRAAHLHNLLSWEFDLSWFKKPIVPGYMDFCVYSFSILPPRLCDFCRVERNQVWRLPRIM